MYTREGMSPLKAECGLISMIAWSLPKDLNCTSDRVLILLCKTYAPKNHQ
jgi:hypothetical protein